MEHQVRGGWRAPVGVAAMLIGAVGIVVGLSSPASAHESSVEPTPVGPDLSCLDLADAFGIDQSWQQSVIDDVADGDHTDTLTLSDRGTPDDTSDDATVTVEVHQGKTFEWSSTVGIDAIYVQGRDTSIENNSYFYLYDHEVTSDVDLGTPPWHEWNTNKIKSISFCWDDEHPGTTTPSSTTSSTSSTTSTSTPTTSSSSTTSTSMAPTTSPSTSPPSSAVSSNGQLPRTGSNSTLPLVGIGLGLLVIGTGLVVSARKFWRPRHLAR